LPTGIGVNVLNELTDLIRVSLQAAHDSFKVFHLDVARFLLVKKIKNFLEVLHFVIGETVEHFLLLLVLVHLLLIFILPFFLIVGFFLRECWSLLVGVIDLLVLTTIVFLIVKLFLVCLLV
jgi:hypothetical protein